MELIPLLAGRRLPKWQRSREHDTLKSIGWGVTAVALTTLLALPLLKRRYEWSWRMTGTLLAADLTVAALSLWKLASLKRALLPYVWTVSERGGEGGRREAAERGVAKYCEEAPDIAHALTVFLSVEGAAEQLSWETILRLHGDDLETLTVEDVEAAMAPSVIEGFVAFDSEQWKAKLQELGPGPIHRIVLRECNLTFLRREDVPKINDRLVIERCIGKPAGGLYGLVPTEHSPYACVDFDDCNPQPRSHQVHAGGVGRFEMKNFLRLWCANRI